MPEVPVITREEPQVCCCNLRKTRRFSLQHKMRPFSTAGSREISYLPSCISKVSLIPLMQEVPQIPVSTREEHLESRHNSRRAPFFPPHLEMRVPDSASWGKEFQRSHRTYSGGGLNLKGERNSRGRATIPKGPDVPFHIRYT